MTCQMDNGLLFEAYGAIWKNMRVGSKEGNKEDVGRCSWPAQAEGWVERQRQRKRVGGRLLCVKEKNKCPAFSILKNAAYLLTRMKVNFSVFFQKTRKASKAFYRCHPLAKRKSWLCLCPLIDKMQAVSSLIKGWFLERNMKSAFPKRVTKIYAFELGY